MADVAGHVPIKLIHELYFPLQKIIRFAPAIVDCAGGDWRLRVGRGLGASVAIWIAWKCHARFADFVCAISPHGAVGDFVLAMVSAKVLLALENCGGAGYWLYVLRLLRETRFAAEK